MLDLISIIVAGFSVVSAVILFSLFLVPPVFYFATLSIVAVFVLVLGFSIPYIDDRFFYVVYTNGIGLAFVLTVAALISMPDLMRNLAEAGRIKYSASCRYTTERTG